MTRRRFAVVLRTVAIVCVVLFALSLASGIYLYTLSRTLPDLTVDPASLKTARTSYVYASDGTLLAQWHGEQDRSIVRIDEVPQNMRDAVVAIEDERFYLHHGVDLRSIARALRVNVGSGQVSEGGSTITQQLIKLLFTDGERNFTRKIREALMAYQLEARTPKDKVLESYLNIVYFGHGAYGVEAASRRYFGKRASALDLAESAMLAAVIGSPTRFSPVDNPDAARERRNRVLTKMREQGFINADEERAARGKSIQLAPPPDIPQAAPYFVEYVKQDLIRRFGADAVYKGGLRVYTTLDPELQRAAERAVKKHLNLDADPEAAVVAIRHTDGSILSMVGGRDFKTDQFNLASQGRRQPGSAFKTFVLVTALESGIEPDETFEATPYSVRVKDGIWNVQNYENAKTAPRISLKVATSYSVNAVYARLIMRLTPAKVVRVAKRMGITSPLDPDPAIALGGLKVGVSPLEMASAYGVIAAGGTRVEPTGIVKVLDDTGAVIYQPDRTRARIISRATAVQASLMLHDVVERGTAVEAKFDHWAAGKTGTTQSYRDAWFVGYAGDVVTSVWVGHRQAQVDMLNIHGIKVTGGSFPARIWRDFMTATFKLRTAPVTPAGSTSETSAPEPAQKALVKICSDSMLRANRNCPNTVDIYLEPGLAPVETCARH